VKLVYVCGDAGVPVLGGKGASVHVRSVTSALVRRGHRVVLAGASVGSGNPIPSGVELVELPSDPQAQSSVLLRLLIAEQADGVVERYSLASGPARRASALLGLPQILEVNAPLVLEAARHRGLTDVDVWLIRERAVLSSADAIGVVSTALVRYVEDQIAGAVPCRWIPNGVDAVPFRAASPARLGIPDGNLVAGFVGSMKGWHGVTDLVEAVRRLGPSAPLHLVMAGSGPESAEVQRRIHSSGLGHRAHLLGQLAHGEVPSLLAAFHVGVAPYTAAADFYFSPLKVLEYLASGLPVVCPALGDLPDLAGDAGIYYRPGDIDGLADALRTMIEQPRRHHSTAEAARARAQRWSWDTNAAAYEQLLEAARSAEPAVTGHGGAQR
jgi:glycosyltransferase involved in cell wall biosynthesis